MSVIKVNAIQNLSGVQQYLASAWVNFNGTGTVSISGSGNVAGITDNGVGDYTINFLNALPSATYSIMGVAGKTAGKNSFIEPLPDTTPTQTTTGFRIGIYNVVTTAGLSDEPLVMLAVVR